MQLEGVKAGIRLLSVDHCIGSVIEQTGDNLGLWLISMGERIRLVGGRFMIRSARMRGTGLEILAPLPTEAS